MKCRNIDLFAVAILLIGFAFMNHVRRSSVLEAVTTGRIRMPERLRREVIRIPRAPTPPHIHFDRF